MKQQDRLPRHPEVRDKWRTALSQRVEVDGLIVRCSRLPAAVQDADPLERQGSHGDLVGAALRALLPVVGARPERPADRLASLLDERLPQEFRTLQAPVDPALLPAALGHRGNARVPLQFFCAAEALALFTEGSQQARAELGTTAPGRFPNSA